MIHPTIQKQFIDGCDAETDNNLQGRAVVAHLAHNQEVAGSIPAPVTNLAASAEKDAGCNTPRESGAEFAALTPSSTHLQLADKFDDSARNWRAIATVLWATDKDLATFAHDCAMHSEIAAEMERRAA